jgi:4-hydroxybenzoate polyprenyltransferase
MLSFLRLEYLPAILIPALAGIYLADGSLLAALPTLVGWSFLAIGQNLLNDYFDKDRKMPVRPKGLLTLFLTFTLFGLILFPLEHMIFPVIFTILIALYNYKIKRIPFGTVIILTIAYVILPFLFYSSNPNLGVLLAVILGGASFQLVHEIMDREATWSFLKENSVTLARILSLATTFLLAYNYLALRSEIFIAGIFVFIITTLGVHKPPYNKDAKIIGIYISIFLTVLIAAYMIKIGMA